MPDEIPRRKAVTPPATTTPEAPEPEPLVADMARVLRSRDGARASFVRYLAMAEAALVHVHGASDIDAVLAAARVPEIKIPDPK
jgi:hypothetical protein